MEARSCEYSIYVRREASMDEALGALEDGVRGSCLQNTWQMLGMLGRYLVEAIGA